MRLSELAKLRGISRERLRRQLELFPGVLHKANPSKANSPMLVNMKILQAYSVNTSQHQEIIERLDKLEQANDTLTESLAALLREL